MVTVPTDASQRIAPPIPAVVLLVNVLFRMIHDRAPPEPDRPIAAPPKVALVAVLFKNVQSSTSMSVRQKMPEPPLAAVLLINVVRRTVKLPPVVAPERMPPAAVVETPPLITQSLTVNVLSPPISTIPPL